MEIQEKDILLNSIRLNLEIFKIKNRIDEKDFNQDIKNEFKDYLFVVDEEENFQINESLMDYNFSLIEDINFYSMYYHDHMLTKCGIMAYN